METAQKPAMDRYPVDLLSIQQATLSNRITCHKDENILVSARPFVEPLS
jgi:hypothetical protein